MANRRKAGKEKVAFWLTKAEKSLLKAIADEDALSMTDAIRQLLITAAKEKKILKPRQEGGNK